MSYRWVQKLYAGRGCILMLHRIRDEPRQLDNNAGLDISSADFKKVIDKLHELDYDIISLDEVLPRLTYRRKQKRFAVLTFDDGYKDNYTKALPICEHYQVPMTVYVTTCFPDKTIVLWWDLLEKLLVKKKDLHFVWQGKDYAYHLENNDNRQRAFQDLKQLILTTATKQQPDLFEQLFFKHGLDNEALCQEILLTWDEIASLDKHPLVTIGAHTQNHLALARLPLDEAWREIEQGKCILEGKLNHRIDHFAYPYGSRLEAGAREFALAQKAEFKTTVTTRHGHLFSAHSHLAHALPRIALSSAKMPKLNGYLSGLHAMVRHRGKRVVSV